MEDEHESCSAIFGEDFEVLPDGPSGLTRWRVRLGEGLEVAVIFTLPEGYPDSGPPTASLEFEQWPAGGDAFAKRIADELRGMWVSGEICIFDWVEHIKGALADKPPELSTGVTQRTADCATSDQVVADATSSGAMAVPLTSSASQAVGPSLVNAGFASCGPGIFSHGDRGVTVEVTDTLSITVDGIDTEDLVDWTTMQLETNVGEFGVRLVEWVTAQRSAEPGFLEDDDAGEAAGLDFLPSAEQLGVDRERELLIYTWGKALRKAAPPDSQFNANAGILNGRGGGADLRTMNGLSDEVQNNVASCGLFPRWIEMVCNKVELSTPTAPKGLQTISINCTKGRHRSVAAAEILKKLYYPKATTKHLTIY